MLSLELADGAPCPRRVNFKFGATTTRRTPQVGCAVLDSLPRRPQGISPPRAPGHWHAGTKVVNE